MHCQLGFFINCDHQFWLVTLIWAFYSWAEETLTNVKTSHVIGPRLENTKRETFFFLLTLTMIISSKITHDFIHDCWNPKFHNSNMAKVEYSFFYYYNYKAITWKNFLINHEQMSETVNELTKSVILSSWIPLVYRDTCIYI